MTLYLKFLLKTAFDDLRRNKIRTLLTSLGILIGVFAVVILIALGVGINNYIAQQFESLGTNLLYVLPGKIIQEGGFSQQSAMPAIKFEERDINDLKRLAVLEKVVPVDSKTVSVEIAKKSERTTLYLTSGDFFTIRDLKAQAGEIFTNLDVEKRTRKVVIGSKIAEKLFGSAANALGKGVRLENQRFEIMGVTESKGGGGLGGPDFDSFTYLPYKSAPSLNPDKKFYTLLLKVREAKDIPLAKKEATTILTRRYNPDEISVVEQTEIIKAIDSIISVVNSVLVAIGSISLLVGGVGIMNIMYAAVTERIKEIGIRRAIGATQRNILLQFLSEALILSLFGGLAGLLLAALVVLAVQSFFPAAINLISVVVAVVVSSLIGVFFGVFPANKAAKLSPIDAIRYE
ncbi:MAG: ABC transporter permease [Candidatus Shapirobacteria bacterium]